MPINSLPSEILAKIMIFTCNSPELLTQFSFTTLWADTLSSVCRHWRVIALDLAEIWSWMSILVYSEPHEDRKMECVWFVRLVQRCLERSKDHLLSLEIYIDSDYDPKSIADAMSLLANHCHRWGTLNLVAPIEALSHEWRTIPNRLTSLRALKLEAGPGGSELWLGFLGRLPSLRSLAIGIDVPLPNHYNTFSKLERLHISPLKATSGPEMQNIIGVSTNLRHLELGTSTPLYFHFTDIGHDFPSITHTTIESLHINMYSDEFLNRLHLTLPRLSSVTFQSLIRPGPFDSFFALIQRSSCTITSFTFTGHFVPRESDLDEQFVALLMHLPCLTTLTVQEAAYDDPSTLLSTHFFEKITAKDPPDLTLIPSLQTLNLMGYHRSIVDPGAFATFVRSRCLPYTLDGLRAVYVWFFDAGPNVEALELLKSLDVGLRVSFGWVA